MRAERSRTSAIRNIFNLNRFRGGYLVTVLTFVNMLTYFSLRLVRVVSSDKVFAGMDPMLLISIISVLSCFMLYIQYKFLSESQLNSLIVFSLVGMFIIALIFKIIYSQ